jgi:F0F1-type ATP synthase assembly protein I
MNNALGFAAEIGVTVALLTVGGIFLGRFLDGRFNIAPFGLLIGMLSGIILASVILVIRTQKLMK